MVPHLLYLRKRVSVRLLLLLPLLVLPEGLQLLSVQLLFQRNLWAEQQKETLSYLVVEVEDKGEGEVEVKVRVKGECKVEGEGEGEGQG